MAEYGISITKRLRRVFHFYFRRFRRLSECLKQRTPIDVPYAVAHRIVDELFFMIGYEAIGIYSPLEVISSEEDDNEADTQH